jgi:hypothetical protein
MAVPLPDGFEPSPGDDHEAVVHQPWSGEMWEFWSTKRRHPHRVAGVFEFLQTGLVPRFAVSGLKCSIGVLGVLTLFTGLVLEMITRTRQELKRLIYLSLSKAAPRG